MNNDFLIINSFSKFIEITGEEKVDFLQGIITNDINKCNNEEPIYSCFLSPQGKFLADFFIVKESDSYLIEIHEKYLESFISKLNIYKLRSKVNLSKKDNISSVILFSNRICEVSESIICFNDPRNPNIGQKIFIEDKYLEQLNNINKESLDIYKEILIKNLVPFSPDVLIENKSLLLENNIQNLQAIDWDKGCYVGQEITARMKYRSLLKKQLYKLEVISGEIKVGDEIIINNTNFGKVITKVNKYMLCMLKIDLVREKNNNKEIIKIDNSSILKFL